MIYFQLARRLFFSVGPHANPLAHLVEVQFGAQFNRNHTEIRSGVDDSLPSARMRTTVQPTDNQVGDNRGRVFGLSATHARLRFSCTCASSLGKLKLRRVHVDFVHSVVRDLLDENTPALAGNPLGEGKFIRIAIHNPSVGNGNEPSRGQFGAAPVKPGGKLPGQSRYAPFRFPIQSAPGLLALPGT